MNGVRSPDREEVACNARSMAWKTAGCGCACAQNPPNIHTGTGNSHRQWGNRLTRGNRLRVNPRRHCESPKRHQWQAHGVALMHSADIRSSQSKGTGRRVSRPVELPAGNGLSTDRGTSVPSVLTLLLRQCATPMPGNTAGRKPVLPVDPCQWDVTREFAIGEVVAC